MLRDGDAPAGWLGRRMAAHATRSNGGVNRDDYTISPHVAQPDRGDHEPVEPRQPDPAATHDRGHRLRGPQHV
jgi:hypothetical protein